VPQVQTILDRAATAADPIGAPRLQVAALDGPTAQRDHESLSSLASGQGWELSTFSGTTELALVAECGRVDLVLVGLAELPSIAEELDRLTERVEAPIVVLGDEEADLKLALRHGASLGVRTPFDAELLALSIEALLQHRSLRALLTQAVMVGDLRVSLANHTVERQGRRQVLSPTEWQLFAFLLLHPGRTFDRDRLASGAWGQGYSGRETEVELYIHRLRRKVERDPRRPEIIETHRNHGYRLRATPAHSAGWARPREIDEDSARSRIPGVQEWTMHADPAPLARRA
jgi:DNA-binding response OmpR family regulator